MKPQRYDDPGAFREDVQDHLVAHEANNNVFFGVVGDAIATPDMYPGDNLWAAAVDEHGEVVGVAMRTPPWPLALSHATTDDAACTLVDLACSTFGDESFDFRTSPEIAQALDTTLRRYGYHRLEVIESQGVYRLDQVVAPTGVTGRPRLATLEDAELAADWAARFSADVDHAVPGDQAERARRVARANIDSGSLFLWTADGEPTSMAAVRGPTPNGIRISLVYTPPEHRRNGYASALVAHVAKRMRDSGRAFVFLFTDLANPTSNHIYQQVGFERVGEETLYRATRPRHPENDSADE